MPIRIIRKIFAGRRSPNLRSLGNILGFSPGNTALYELAFRHRSRAKEEGNRIKHSNERLEYLGDAILGAVVADFLFKKFPFREEGFLTEMRSKIVSREHLNKLSLKIGLGNFILNNPDNPRNRSMMGDAFEALIGAIYLDKGYITAQRFIVNRIIRHHIDIDELETKETNFKSRLIEWAQKEKKTASFELVDEVENGNNKLLKVHAIVDGEPCGTGMDSSKKKAEQIAAEQACIALSI